MQKEENFIIFSDVKQIFIRFKWWIGLCALVCSLIAICIRLASPVYYEIGATFRESEITTNVSRDNSVIDMIKSFNMQNREGKYIITSTLILRPVVEELGLQVSVYPEGVRGLGQIYRAWLAELRKPLPSIDRCVFKHVCYRGQAYQEYQLVFISNEAFECRTRSGETLVQGIVGTPVTFNDVTLTVAHVPRSVIVDKVYTLRLSPLEPCLFKLQDSIEVETSRGSQSLIHLTFKNTDRDRGKLILETLMHTYRSHLINESHRVSQEQLAYLEKRRNVFCQQMDEFLTRHVSYLKETIGTTGFLTLSHKIPFIQDRKSALTENLLNVNMELDVLKGATSMSAFRTNSEMMSLQKELHSLAKQRDDLELALMSRRDLNLEKHLIKLDDLDAQSHCINGNTDRILSYLFKGLHHNQRTYDTLAVSQSEFGQVLSPNAHHLVAIQKEKDKVIALASEKHSASFAAGYLDNLSRLLSMQEQVFKRRVFHLTDVADEFKGIDIQTLKTLLLNCLNDRERRSSILQQLQFVKSQIDVQGVEWSSLATFLPDPLSQSLTDDIGRLLQESRKKESFTDRELERQERIIDHKKSNLRKHMDQMTHLEQLQIVCLNEQIASLQTALVDSLNQEITVLEQQIKDRVKERIFQLHQEKEHVQNHIATIEADMGSIPDAWLKERQLQFSFDLNQGMLESLVRLVETKNIESNLASVESKPLDVPYADVLPLRSHLALAGCLGACVGAFLGMGLCMGHGLYHGIPLTSHNLKVRGKTVLGCLADSQLELFRKISNLINETPTRPLVVTHVLGDRIDYSEPLAHILAKEGKRLLVVNLDTTRKRGTANYSGLVSYLDGRVNEPELVVTSYGAFVSMGQKTQFGDELLKSSRFKQFVHQVKERYDLVLLALPKNANASLPKSFFDVSDMVIVSVASESFDQLEPYFIWGNEGHSLAFLY